MYNSHTSQVSATLTVFTKVTTFFSKLLSVASQVQTHITDQRWSRIHMSTLVNTFLQYSLPQSFRRNLAWNCTVFQLHFVSMLKVWRSVSKGCSLPICLSSPPAFLRETNCPTSPPVSPLTRPWWWASCLHSTLSYPSVMVLQEMIIFSCVCVYICGIAEGSGCPAEMSGQEESGSGVGRQQCWSTHPAVSCLHTVRLA